MTLNKTGLTGGSLTPLVMHVDMDAFFAAIEELDDPSLRGKAVIVGARPGTRGVVSTCNYEARRYGIRSAMPIARAFAACPDGIYRAPRMERYAAVSKRMMLALSTISPVVEQVSVDEAYVDATGLEAIHGDPFAIGRRTRDAVLSATGLSCSVGIGPNRLIAKIASDIDKPGGLTVVSPAEVPAFLAPLPVSSLRGVGRVLEKELLRAGLSTVADLRRWDRKRLTLHFGERTGATLYNQARGIASCRVGTGEERKSISKETTFNEDVADRETILETMKDQAAEIGRLARRKGFRARCVQIRIRLAGFETHTRQKTLEKATDIDNEIFAVARALYGESGFAGRPLRLIGVGISRWEKDAQLGLFSGKEEKKKRDLMNAKDRIVARFGKEALGIRKPRENRPPGEAP